MTTKKQQTYKVHDIEIAVAALKKAKPDHWQVAVHFLSAEIRRRKIVRKNGGRKPVFDDDKHKAGREAAARYYQKKKKLEKDEAAKAKAAVA